MKKSDAKAALAAASGTADKRERLTALMSLSAQVADALFDELDDAAERTDIAILSMRSVVSEQIERLKSSD